jgi:putative tryptophan/tyrosine transport system substrate-binding protein
MKRRTFIAGLGGAAVWPLTLRAQHPARLPVIGFLGAASPETAKPWVAAFIKRMGELGWSDGRTVTIEYRWADAKTESYRDIAAEFVRLKVDVIVTWASAPVVAAKQATTLIPVVFAAQMDPVGVGVVASLARPGGNITGMSIQQTDTAGKRIELLREVVPKIARLAVMANVSAPGAVLEMREVLATARGLGLDAIPIEIHGEGEIASAVGSLRERADALYLATDPLLASHRIRINELARDQRLPMISGNRDYADAGALMSYGPNWADLFRRAAEQVDKILRGAKPADIPVEQPTKFDLVINLKTAKAIGLEIPAALLARADEVIE